MLLPSVRLALLLCAGLAVAAGRPQPPEEEEKPAAKKPDDPKPDEKKDDPKPDEPAAEGPDGVYVFKLANLQRAADSTPHDELKPVFKRFAVAFDELTERGGKVSRITPQVALWGASRFPAEFGAAEVAPDNAIGEVRAVTTKQVLGLVPFERLALEAADVLLGQGRNATAPKLAAGVRLEAAERLLREVLFFHDAARTANRRLGAAWNPLKGQLDAKLADVRVRMVRDAGAAKDWPRVRSLTDQYLDRYKADKAIQEALLSARLMEAEAKVQSDSFAELETARLLLGDYDSRFPGGPSPAAKAVRQALAKKAQEFLQRATREAPNNKTEARRILDAVQAIDPDNKDIRGLRQELKTAYPTLIVGARRLPERMSPALARFDSEKQAVELLFEGLLEPVPDEATGYALRPALAASRPTVGGGVRDVELVRNADWGGDRGALDAVDVYATWLLNRQASGTWAADANTWLDEPQPNPDDAGRIRLRFKLGHPDPRLLLTQKLLPGNWLRANNVRADAVSFARQPVGTGPFRLAPDFKPRGPTDPAKDVVFVSNPAYARRPGRPAQPAIQEVRFVDLGAITDPVADFRAGRLHVLTDVPTADLLKYTSENNLNNAVKVTTATTNLRVWGLAVNHRRPHFHDPDLRRAISKAIDRELILNEVFRAGRTDFHAALAGPYPPGAWCAPRPLGAAPPPLFDRSGAERLLTTALGAASSPGSVSLLYPADDDQAKGACGRIAAMLQDAAKPSGKAFTVTPEPVPPRELLERVEQKQAFDLAYLPLDYPDPFFPLGLGSFLDPTAAQPGGRNVTGWRSAQAGKTPADERLAVLLDEARRHQDPKKLTQLGEGIFTAANEAVPWVPLWQLDRHMVTSTAVRVRLPGKAEPVSPAVLDATTLFSGVGRWSVE